MNTLSDLFIFHIGQLATIAGATHKPKIFDQMNDLSIIPDGAVAIKDGNFIDVGTTKTLKKKYYHNTTHFIDASDKVVLPGFVDSHTHAVFGGERSGEFIQRIQGTSYLDILKKGGGILSTVRHTRELSEKNLIDLTKKHLDDMLLHGTTTVEIKSGYGLDQKNEIKILKAIQGLQKTHTVDIVPTFLGAHVIPVEYKNDTAAYVSLVCDMMLSVKHYATFCDVFCDEGAFHVQQARQILETAKNAGFQLKIHTNEFKDIGGVSLAVDLGVTSADHLDVINDQDMIKLKDSHIVCVLLPGIPFFLLKDIYAPAKKMIGNGLYIALATDFNPGTCPCNNMQMIITLACLKMGLTPAQAINAVTINAAHALSMSHRIGSIETGKQADLIILDIHDYNQLPYYFGINHVETVIKKGKPVVENKVLL